MISLAYRYANIANGRTCDACGKLLIYGVRLVCGNDGRIYTITWVAIDSDTLNIIYVFCHACTSEHYQPYKNTVATLYDELFHSTSIDIVSYIRYLNA